METYIPMEDVLVMIKYSKHITPEERIKYEEKIKWIYSSDLAKEKLKKPIIKNQKRKKL